jgi:hypothetical protein
MMNAIHSRGAFRYFRDSIERYRLVDQWYRFRNAAIRRIAIDWCGTNKIEYIEKNQR